MGLVGLTDRRTTPLGRYSTVRYNWHPVVTDRRRDTATGHLSSATSGTRAPGSCRVSRVPSARLRRLQLPLEFVAWSVTVRHPLSPLCRRRHPRLPHPPLYSSSPTIVHGPSCPASPALPGKNLEEKTDPSRTLQWRFRRKIKSGGVANTSGEKPTLMRATKSQSSTQAWNFSTSYNIIRIELGTLRNVTSRVYRVMTLLQ